MPRNYLPDTHIVRSALGMTQDLDPVPPVDKYSSYPNLLPYTLIPVYVTHFAVGWVRGDWANPQEYRQLVAVFPDGVHQIGRWLILLFGLATPWVVLRAGRAAGLGAGAWAAAAFVATGLMHLHFSVQERPWVPMVFFAALAAWPAALYQGEARLRWLLWSGVWAACSAACHQSGFFVLALPGLAWALAPGGWSGAELVRRLKHGFSCVGLFALVVLAVGYPAYLRYGIPEASQDAGSGELFAIGGQGIDFGRRWESLPILAKAFFGHEPILSLLALPGLFLLWRLPRARPVLLFTVLWAAFFMTHSNPHVRYLLPVAVLLALPAGAAVEALWRRGVALRAVAILLCALPLVQAARLSTLLSREDLRSDAERVVAELPPGSLVAIDRYGPACDLDRESLETLLELRTAAGSMLYLREGLRLKALKAELLSGGAHAVRLEDLFDIDELAGTVKPRRGLEDRLGPDVESAFERLGVTHFLLVNRLAEGTEGSLLAGFVEGRVPQRVLRPYAESAGGEARLPVELGFPLTSIWRLERPGPWMALYEL